MGLIFACITGLGLPSFIFLVGDVINSFDPSVSRAEALKTMLKILYIFIGIGSGVWILSYLFYSKLIIFSERVAKTTRREYLRSVLR